MTYILTIAMQKGGVGKTTTALNLGVNLANLGKRVLLIDLDPQANLSQGLGVTVADTEPSVYEVLLNPEQGAAFAIRQSTPGVDLIPSTLALAGAELELSGHIGRELLLREALRPLDGAYDYILIDTPPNLSLFTLNALAASTAVIVPLQTQVYSFTAMPQLEATIDLVRKLNPALHIAGIVCTMMDRRTMLSQAIEQQIRARYANLVYDTVIPINTKLAEAPASGQPITLYDPQSPGALAYAALAEEVEVCHG